MAGEKQGIFFVDTKSTCFFCLEDIPPRPPPVIDLDDDEDDVGTTVTCEQTRGVSLEKIHKYLDLDPGLILRTKLTGGSLLEWAGSQLMNTNLKVAVCGDCERVTDELTDMCDELETLQKRILNGIGVLESILKASLEDSEKENTFKSKLISPVDILQGSIANVMRKATVEKCIDVLLKPHEGNSAKVPISSISPPSTSTTAAASPPPPQLNLLNDDIMDKLIVPARYKCGICDLAVTSMSSLQDHTRKKHNIRLVIYPKSDPTLACNSCGMVIDSKEDWSNHTYADCQAHLTSQSSVTATQLATVSADVLSPLNISPHFKCSDCGKYLETLEIFEKHIKVYCKNRPSTALNATSVPIPTAPKRSRKAVAGHFPCDMCSSVFRHSPSLGRHKRSAHPGCQAETEVPVLISTFSLAESSPCNSNAGNSGSNRHECEYCGSVLSCSSALGRHKRQNCSKFRQIISSQQEELQSQETEYMLSPADEEEQDQWNEFNTVVDEEHFVVKQEEEEELMILPN